MAISVIIPTYNEEENVKILHAELKAVLNQLRQPYEIIFIDDGSRDRTFENLLELRKKDKKVKLIRFRKNFGQTAAMDAGFKAAKGDVIIAMDSDLQNDPADIPLLLQKIDEGYDVVSGWRWNRKDSLSKKLFSFVANIMRRRLTRETIHDSGCSLKAYRKECFKGLDLYGEMHRYIPAILAWRGFRVGEVKVNHRPRMYGKTKYNVRRVFKGFFDLLFIKFWNDYSTRPIHFFGSIAFFQYFLAGLILVEQVIKAFIVRALNLGPLLVLAAVLVITGSLTFLFGFLAEILIRTYYKDKQNYVIEKKLL